ncbi:protein TolR, partial [Sphingomonas koreensis]
MTLASGPIARGRPPHGPLLSEIN